MLKTLLKTFPKTFCYAWRKPLETFAKVGERDEVQGVRNTGGETYQ